jgi:hypothetical protein
MTESVYIKPKIAVPASRTFIASAADPADLTTYTFTSVSIGDAALTRRVIVGIIARDPASNTALSISSVTIGGIAAAQIYEVQNSVSSGSRNVMAFYAATVPTGTTATIVVTLSRAAQRMGIAVWRAMNLRSVTAFATASSSDLATQTLSLNVPTNGVALGLSFGDNNPTISWSGLTEDTQFVVETNLELSAASTSVGAAQSPLSIVATLTTVNNVAIGAAISLR